MNEEKLERKDLCLYFSLISSDIYYISKDEIKNLDKYQIPLLKKPKTNCKCYGRGHIGFNLKTKTYQLCKCMQVCIDFKKVKDHIDIETIKLQ